MVGNYTYDNLRHNTYAFGIGIEWGGTHVHRVDPAIEERLTDPVDRYLAELGHGSKIPTSIKDQSTGGSILLADNIAFFSQTGGPDNGGTNLTITNCTFESPCGPTDFTQTSVTTLGGLLPNTQFYFNGGNYTVGDTSLNLLPGQSIQSRSADFSQPATGTARSSITVEGMNLQGDNTLENIVLLRVNNPSGNANGVTVTGENNSIVGSQIGEPIASYETGISDFGTNTRINNTTIFANTSGYDGNGSTAVIENSVINVGGGLTADNIYGIVFSAPNSNLTVNNTQIQVENSGFNQDTFGILAAPLSVVNVNSSTIEVNGVTGFRTYDLANANSTLVVNGGALSANSNGIDVGIVDPALSPVTIQGGTVCQVNGATVAC